MTATEILNAVEKVGGSLVLNGGQIKVRHTQTGSMAGPRTPATAGGVD
jgi:hypothetical protein